MEDPSHYDKVIASADRKIAEIDRILAFRQLEFYKPYPKQFEFHAAGAKPGIVERLLMAGNQLGKTLCASNETAMHATGEYPEYWPGAIFKKPTVIWAASNTSQGTRDTVQRMLLGRPGEFGTGAIPKSEILDIKKATHGVADAVETVTVRHRPTKGVSRITIKTYDQGRERWQGDSINVLWCDEEPPEDIYTEGRTRTNATGGIVYITFTPLLGMSTVVRRFLIDKTVGTHVTQMTIADALHFTPEERARIIASYPIHERDARTKGIPILGSGRIFPVEEELIREPPLQIPNHWPRIVGMDFGYDHPTAVVWVAWDRDSDTMHIYDTYKRREATPALHSTAVRSRGTWIPVAWPHDGLQHDKGGSCITLAQQYRDMGVNMLRDHATHPPSRGMKEGEGGYGLEAGLMEMFDRMQTGRMKVARHLNDWFEEFRLYHRQDGKVVKEGDDLMSATRVAMMMLRKSQVFQKPKQTVIQGYRPTVPGMGCLG